MTEFPRIGKHALAAVAGLGAVVLVLVGCTSDPGTPASDAQSVTSIAHKQRAALMTRLSRDVACKAPVVITDELTFFDRVLGRDCETSDGEVIVMRVYERSTSAAQVLAEWAPTLDASRQVVWGEHWFVIGPPSALKSLERATSTRARATVPTPTPLTAKQDQMTVCGRLLESAVRAYLFDPSAYGGNRPEFEAMFPGARSQIERGLSAHVADELKGLGEDRAMATITDQLPDLKAICASLPSEES